MISSAPIRLVMADDSAAVRRLVSDILSDTKGVEIVGTARNGQEALSLITQTNPDIVLLDVEMPVMDGITTLKQIRRTDKRTPVLMFSSLTVRGGEATLEALSSGANDYVAKPSGASHVSQAIEYVRLELVPKIKLWGRRKAEAAAPSRPRPAAPVAVNPGKPSAKAGPVDVIAIGSSTGGPNALADVIGRLPSDIGVPILIVQHMPPLFTQLLAERLDRVSSLSVREGVQDAIVKPGEVWVAPGDHHMTVRRVGGEVRLALNQSPPENSCRPAVDVLFRSIADVYGGNCLSVVLTGMGKDGTEGCRRMKQKGTFVVAQDEATCVVWGMPRAVTEAGLADRILPLGDIHNEIIRHARIGRETKALV